MSEVNVASRAIDDLWHGGVSTRGGPGRLQATKVRGVPQGRGPWPEVMSEVGEVGYFLRPGPLDASDGAPGPSLLVSAVGACTRDPPLRRGKDYEGVGEPPG